MFKNDLQAEKFFREHEDIFYPPSGFGGYEIVNEDKENLKSICALLSNGMAREEDICFDDKYEFVDSLIEAGFVTGDLEQQYTLAEMVSEINKVIRNAGHKITLSEEDVLSRDDETVKSVRQSCKYLTARDLNVCAELIAAQGCKLFQVFLDCGGLTMAILPESRMCELKKYFD